MKPLYQLWFAYPEWWSVQVEGSNAVPRSGKIDVQSGTELVMAVSEVVWECPAG